MDQNNFTVETRAWVDRISDINDKIVSLGAKHIETLYIVDEFYADLSEFNPEQHTFEQSKKAARIRTVTDKNNNQHVIAQIREAPNNTPPEIKLHDVTAKTYEKQEAVEQKDLLIEELKEKGFDSLITKVSKERKTYTLDNHTIHVDDIDGYSTALEIKTDIRDINQAREIKSLHLNLIDKLEIPKEDLIEKSHTHLIIDSYFKSQPKLKEEMLRKKLQELIKEKEKLMLESEECFREGGDGWHDNARWDILRENIDVISIRISKLKNEIFELSQNK
jgi:predicted adenylyl cyclase CyaB